MSHVDTKDLHPEVWKLFDRYVHGLIDRRGFLDGADQMFQYPGTQHGFHNDTTPRYSRDAATLAWQRTIDHFKKHLITT